MALLIILYLLLPGTDYESIFGEDYSRAVSYMEEIRPVSARLSELYGTDLPSLEAVIFPEAIRYSIIRDYLETRALELIYIGKGTADFSIGPFQIKPSFAEKLEEYVKADTSGFQKFTGILRYEVTSPSLIRAERLARLKQAEYQLVYINLFIRTTEILHPHLHKPESEEYRIRFLSTAYNYRFDASRGDIEKFMSLSYFPFGSLNDRKKYNYSEIAWAYYNDRNK